MVVLAKGGNEIGNGSDTVHSKIKTSMATGWFVVGVFFTKGVNDRRGEGEGGIGFN